MKVLTNSVSSLRWQQADPHSVESWLLVGDDVVAALHPIRMGKTQAAVSHVEGELVFQSRGFLRQHINVQGQWARSGLTSFQSKWNGEGSLVCADGRRFRWHPTDNWGTEWVWETQEHVHLIRFESSTFLSNSAGMIEILQEDIAHQHLMLLLFLGWYLVVFKGGSLSAAAILLWRSSRGIW